MSQGFHQGIFSSFSDGFDRSSSEEHENRPGREKQAVVLQGVGFNEHPLVTIQEEEEEAAGDIYHQAAGTNMLSEMFNFPGQGVAASDLLAAYHTRPAAAGGFSVGTTDHLNHWYGSSTNRQGRMVLGSSSSSSTNLSSLAAGDHDDDQQQLMPAGLNTTNSAAAAMQLFLMNPTRSPPPPHDHPSNNSSLQLNHLIHTSTSSFGDAPSFGGVVEGQGLSLSLASSLQQPYEMAKAADQELRLRDGVLYFNQSQQLQQQQHHQPPSVVHLHDHGHGHGHGQQHISQGQQMGGAYGTMGVVNVLRNSRYSRAAQELLEEFCSVGRGQVLKSSTTAGGRNQQQLHSNTNPIGGGASADPPTKDHLPPLSSSDKFEHQRKKAKLLSMFDEVDRRYHQYCEQMQMVVNSFDSVMGFGAATPYTALAQKAMSRHFRCLKDAVAAQLKQTCEVLGEKDAGGGSSSGGITKGETPRLRVLDQTLRQQRAFHQIGMMDQEAWRPQRGLPERSVTILRAWLFEHFLHPYPSDADKHLLARQTGLSRNQVSNWFINARVRLWKPMVEEMYQQEAKDREEEAEEDHLEAEMSETTEQQQHHQITESSPTDHDLHHEQSSDHHHHHQRFAISSSSSMAYHHHHIQAAAGCSELSRSSAYQTGGVFIATPEMSCNIPTAPPTTDHNIYDHSTDYEAAATKAHITFPRAAGDHVSLTLGLRHAGNAPDHNTRFTVRDFGDHH